MKNVSMITVLAMVACLLIPAAFAADEMVQVDSWYDGPPADPFNVQAWADYWPSDYQGDSLAVVLDTDPSNYPISVEQVDFLCGNDADVNLGAYIVRIYRQGPDGMPDLLIWQSPDAVGWTGFQSTSSVYLQANFQSLWPEESLPVINHGPFIVSVEYALSEGQTDVCADEGYPQEYHKNLVRYNPANHGGTEDQWKWVYAEDAGEISGKALTHNFIIRAHINHNVPPATPTMGTTGLMLLLGLFSFIVGKRKFRK